jgi:predicted nuclease of predicted toxin-antitoxin system
MALRFKLDENLPARLESALRDLGHDVETAYTERLAGAADAIILAACRVAPN